MLGAISRNHGDIIEMPTMDGSRRMATDDSYKCRFVGCGGDFLVQYYLRFDWWEVLP